MHKINALSKAIGKKVVGTASDVLSAPSRARHAIRGAKYDRERNALTTARKYDKAPNYDGSGKITDAFKARSVAEGIRRKYSK